MMSNAKKAPKRRRGAKVVPVVGAAGLLSLAGGAFAATSGAPVADLPTQKTEPNHEIILGEEELSDVSLSTTMSSTRKAPSLSLVTRSPPSVPAPCVAAAVVAAAVVSL
jgi:hypothetical protein